MPHSTRRPKPRSTNLHGYKPVLDRINEFLDRTNPDLEQAKIDKVILALFGEEPTGFDDPLGLFTPRHPDDKPPSPPEP